jgi:hypothetical protein
LLINKSFNTVLNTQKFTPTDPTTQVLDEQWGWKCPPTDFNRLIILTEKTIIKNMCHVATSYSNLITFTMKVMGDPILHEGTFYSQCSSQNNVGEYPFHRAT